MQPITYVSAVGIHIANPTVNNTSSGPVSVQPEIKQEQQIDKSVYNLPQASVYGNQPNSASAGLAFKAAVLK